MPLEHMHTVLQPNPDECMLLLPGFMEDGAYLVVVVARYADGQEYPSFPVGYVHREHYSSNHYLTHHKQLSGSTFQKAKSGQLQGRRILKAKSKRQAAPAPLPVAQNPAQSIAGIVAQFVSGGIDLDDLSDL